MLVKEDSLLDGVARLNVNRPMEDRGEPRPVSGASEAAVESRDYSGACRSRRTAFKFAS